jgi:hypothetical protein
LGTKLNIRQNEFGNLSAKSVLGEAEAPNSSIIVLKAYYYGCAWSDHVPDTGSVCQRALLDHDCVAVLDGCRSGESGPMPAIVIVPTR